MTQHGFIGFKYLHISICIAVKFFCNFCLSILSTKFFFTDAKAFGVDGYGAKASEKLMTVRGKDFRHEKTKKKRGSYRGGSITMDSNSFKYD